MYYGEIKNCDIANGEGVRVTLFVSGCTNHCKNCFQPQTWDFCYGQPFTTETEDYLLSLLSPVYINGLTLLGGEPFEPENQRALVPFLRRVRQMYPDKTIWGFSGFTYEELLADEDKKKIFDRFYRVDKARTRQKGGFGLGLSLAQQIVLALKGTIVVKDNHPKGTIFEVKITGV